MRTKIVQSLVFLVVFAFCLASCEDNQESGESGESIDSEDLEDLDLEDSEDTGESEDAGESGDASVSKTSESSGHDEAMGGLFRTMRKSNKRETQDSSEDKEVVSEYDPRDRLDYGRKHLKKALM